MRKQLDAPGRIVQEVPLPFDAAIRKPAGSPRELCVLLHGHSETGQKILGKLESALPEDTVIVAPNGPFPIVEWVGTDWKKRQAKYTFCWHFYEPASDAYFISPETALAHIERGLKALGYADLPKRIIGFSQGGYLATYAAQRLTRVEQVIAIGCEFLPDEIREGSPFRLDGVFGAKDHIVKQNVALSSHAEAVKRTRGGEVFQIPDLIHEIDQRVVAKVADLVRNCRTNAS